MSVTKYRHPRWGEVTLSANPRARRISLGVRLSGEVRLSFPPSVSPERALRFLDEKAEWVEAALRKMAQRRAAEPPRLSAEEEKLRVERLRREAKIDLPQRIERLSRLTGLKYNSVTVRLTRSKWGSCSSRNDISLSLLLMTLPEHLRDFVILHELCHTREHNHSVRFHALLDKLVGGREKELQRELRRYSTR